MRVHGCPQVEEVYDNMLYLRLTVLAFLMCIQLSSFPAGLFEKLTNLKALQVSFLIHTYCLSVHNTIQLSSLFPGLFKKLTNLEFL